MKKVIYLDYNATTPVDKRVLDKMLPYFTNDFGNAASRTHAYGWIAKDAVKTGRGQVAELINCTPQEVVFTSGATEAINLAIKGVWEVYQTKGKHIITSQTEHKAVLDTCHSLEKLGAKLTYLAVNKDGLIDLDELRNAMTSETILVSIMYANNETGVIQPIKEIAEIVHQHNSIFMCDATQAIGKLPINVQTEGIDLMCISAHKFYGPKGVGALYISRKKPRVNLLGQIEGGGHERGLRSGTLNVPGIVGLGAACQLAQEEMAINEKQITKLRSQLEDGINELYEVTIHGGNSRRLYTTSSICFHGMRSENILSQLSNIAVAMGSACTSETDEPSHVLKAMNVSDNDSYSTLRFSIGKYTTEEEVSEVIKKVTVAVNQIRKKVDN